MSHLRIPFSVQPLLFTPDRLTHPTVKPCDYMTTQEISKGSGLSNFKEKLSF